MPLIRIKSGPDKGKAYDVGEKPVVIGREASDGIRILDQGASRRHAEVFKIGEMYFIRDLDSKNGTFVNDERVMEELLQVGDKLKVGTTVFVFEEGGVVPEATPGFEFSAGDQLEATIEIDLSKMKKTDFAEGEPRSVRNLKALFELGRAIVAEEDEKELMNAVLRLCVDVLSADAGYVFVTDPAGRLIPKAIQERSREEGRKISRSIIKNVFKTHKALMTSDAAQDARFKDRQSVVIKKIQSVICVPLLAFEKIKGVMYLHGSGLELAFSSEDLELATFIGIQAGNVLEGLHASLEHKRILMSAIKTLVGITELRNPRSQGHSERVCVYSASIAGDLDLPPATSRHVQIAALLHDVGKIVKSDRTNILERRENGKAEGDAEEDHVLHGENIIRHMEGMEKVLPGIRHHHENFDGSGYPDGLAGEDIPRIARIIRVADALDHLLHDVPSDNPPIKEAVVRIGKNDEGLFDPAVCKAVVRAYRNGTLFTPEKLLLEDYFQAAED
jgi:HD-GYP domain-containing protein (c-di-GMP phosphodiesterase class II)